MPIKYVKMVAKKSMRYGTRAMKAGEEFDVNGETDARLYEALGHADRVDGPKAPAPVIPKPAAKVAAKKVAAKKTTSRFSAMSFRRDFDDSPAPAASPDSEDD